MSPWPGEFEAMLKTSTLLSFVEPVGLGCQAAMDCTALACSKASVDR